MKTRPQEAGARRVQPSGRPSGAPYGLDAPAGLWERLCSAGTGGFERLFQTPKHNLIRPEIGPTIGNHFTPLPLFAMTEISKDLQDYLQSIPSVTADDLEELKRAVLALDDDPGFQADLIKGQFVEAILQAMEAHGQTQSQVAAAWGKSRQYLSKVLNEDRRVNFTVETMTQLAHAVGRRLQVKVEEPTPSGVTFTAARRMVVGRPFDAWNESPASSVLYRTDPQVLSQNYQEWNPSRPAMIQHEDSIAA
jgi:transcriptional regulator with XRE-family HTH domain